MGDARVTCVLLPCSDEEGWALPQSCLGEIVTAPAVDRRPPAEISWRGRQVPVLDRWEGAGWCDAAGEAGLVAVVLPLPGTSGECWGVALGSRGPVIAELEDDEVEQRPVGEGEGVLAAFRYRDAVYGVPDLQVWQAVMAARGAAA